LTLSEDSFYADLVFYNIPLKCYVIIELKSRKLKHQDLGQLQMYVNYFDREIKDESDNKTIGILLCSDKNESVVEYSLPKANEQIFASKYKLYLPSKRELEEELF
jgi:RecB family endonuclease NucS